MRTSKSSILTSASLTAVLALLAGCSVSKATQEVFARSEISVKEAQQAVGGSESGAIELQRARDHLADAQQAIDDRNDELAVRHAQQAALDARLATAKSQSAIARKAADDLQASVQTLREEAQRSMPVSR